VPSFARIPKHALEQVRHELLIEGKAAHQHLDRAFERFEESQPALSRHVGDILGRPLGEATTALGFFLSLAVWMAFDRCHGSSLNSISTDELRSTRELVSLDENLRESEPTEPLETDDVIAMEQPALVQFVHEHIEATLDLRGKAVDADELQMIYRMVLIEMLALSYAIKTPTGFPVSKAEALA
jgi:hypothetical protein